MTPQELAMLEPFYARVTDACLAAFAAPQPPLSLPLVESLMDINGLPMHCPIHHYIIPAALLVVCRRAKGQSEELLRQNLDTALERARNVPGGFCGFYGACGAAVGLGIFFSVITDGTPMSAKSWAWANRATGAALLAMAEYGGPRCCKRTGFAALQSVRWQVLDILEVDIGSMEGITCRYHERNGECLRAKCPYYPAGLAAAGTEAAL